VTSVDVRPAADRFATNWGWLDSRHTFSFGRHYDPNNTHFGLLLVSNDDRVRAGTGFETHPHRDMEIVTWVLEGSLVHQDSTGHSGVIYPGLAQRMSAGTGIQHSEKNDAWTLNGEPEHADDVHFVQMWVLPDERGAMPGYEQLDIGDELAGGGLVTVASGMAKHADDRAIAIHQKHAALHSARMGDTREVALPEAPFVNLYVASGSTDLEGFGLLQAGDSARVTDSEGQRVRANGGAEILVWEMNSTIGA
jgi:redox-sensitive bicupin YhaK (pirin superfamily)